MFSRRRDLRAGFERMVAEVCMGKVGAVAARSLPSSRATARLAATGGYAGWSTRCSSIRGHLRATPRQRPFAPRSEGSLNEYELDLLRQRSLAAL